jgi:PleD family two-component response regulator
LRQNLDQLEFVVATGAGIQADPLNDLNTVLESLYLEDEKINSSIRQLEHLKLLHQNLSVQGAKYRQETKNTEQQIFWLLGFKLRESSNRERILIIDDTPINVTILSAALKKHGYEVNSAANGTSGLSKVHEFRPDLILLDIMMPGINGYEVCKQLKAEPKTYDIPVIFISAMSDAIDKAKAFRVGGADYIPKPFHIEEILARVEHQINIRNLQKRLEQQNEQP